jgi:hypothetical protein
MAEISDAAMDERLAKVRGYCLLILKAGPNYVPPDSRPAEQAAIIREHGRRNMKLRAEGKMALVAPVVGARPIVGLAVFTVPEAEARSLMANDPAVLAGILTAEWATWFGVPGDALPAA